MASKIIPTASAVMMAQDAAARAVREWSRAAEHSDATWTMEAMAAEAAAKRAMWKAVKHAERMAQAAAMVEA